ncbi:MAG: PH domain-containing protein [Thermoplasmatales archaeon]|nr:MAG: PH domain-containing protein [Thermoplasmatales archaeon]
MKDEELLTNEIKEKILSPHPLSFMKFQALCIFLLLWGIIVGWMINFSEWQGAFTDNIWLALSFWGIGLLLVGVIASLSTIKWSIFLLYLVVFLTGTLIIIWQEIQNAIGLFVPIYTIVASIIGFLLVEWYRRSHKYIITDQRLIFKGGITIKRERSLRYENVVEYDSERGVLGQIFGFGTIIPQTPSGVGMGSDSAMAAGGIAVGAKKSKLFGVIGGEREVQTPRTRTYYELHGVYPFKEVKQILEKHKQGSAPTTHHKEQVAFQQQQVDIQKQMRDLLKMQTEGKEEITEPPPKKDTTPEE